MLCPKCGSQNPYGARFCSTCGANLQGFTGKSQQAPVFDSHDKGGVRVTPDLKTTAASSPRKRSKAPIIVGALLAIAAIVLVGLFVLIPALTPEGSNSGSLAPKTFSTGTLDLSTDAYAPVKLQVSKDSITVDAGYPFDIHGTFPIKSKADQGDVTVYDLNFSSVKMGLDADSGEVTNQEFGQFSVKSFQVSSLQRQLTKNPSATGDLYSNILMEATSRLSRASSSHIRRADPPKSTTVPAQTEAWMPATISPRRSISLTMQTPCPMPMTPAR